MFILLIIMCVVGSVQAMFGLSLFGFGVAQRADTYERMTALGLGCSGLYVLICGLLLLCHMEI